jgi:CubicO group peptidase (beta-lactamase class C family)
VLTDALPFAVAVLTAALAAWIAIKLRVYPRIAAGYRAKVVCTGVFGSGRDLDQQLLSQVSADSYWLLRPFRLQIDRSTQSVTASLAGRFARTAFHRDGLGATLASRRAPSVIDTSSLVPQPTARPHVWRVAGSRAQAQRIVDRAFDEPNPARLRRTFAVVVVHDGQIVAERYAAGFTVDMPMPGWSMAKSVLNTLVGILVHEGRLSLDRRELLPHWRAPDPRAAITVEDLLRMRSGLRFSEAYANPWSDVLHMLYDCDDTAGYSASVTLATPVGSVWSYGSGSTNILSQVVRRTVGDSEYHAWPRRALFDRIGMASACLEPDASGTFVCSSYMLATARDWARFGQLWIDRGRWDGSVIVPDQWIRFSTTPTPQSPGGRFGAHWWLKLNPEIGGDSAAAREIAPDAFFAVGHEGQTLSIIPSKRLVVVRLGGSIYVDAWNQAEFVAALQQAL